MTIHKIGHRTLIILFIVLLLINLIIIYFFGNHHLLADIVSIVSVLFFLLILRFFRSPKRNIITDEDKIFAPADGKIVVIEETEEPEYFKDKRIQISIFMSIFDVHINWYPVSGVIKYYKYHTGRFLAAWLPKSSTDNERNTIVIERQEDRTKILMRQIAGAVARRIISNAKVGNKVTQNSELGFIRLGSRVDVFLPLDTKINVKLGQKVKGTQTVIAEFK